MKKLVSSIACLMICFSIHAQTQTGKVSITPVSTEKQVEKSSEQKATPAPATHQCEQHKAAEQKAEPAATPHACPKAATCPKAQAAAAGNQGEAKPCCAKHQGTQSEAAKTEQKAGCNHNHQNADQKAGCNHHQNANQKAGCNHNHGSSEKPAATPQKKGTGKK